MEDMKVNTLNVYSEGEIIKRRCPYCGRMKLKVLSLEIFNRGVHSSREHAYTFMRLRCGECGEVQVEQKVRCRSCGSHDVSMCYSEPIIIDGASAGVKYTLRCKSCGYIWQLRFNSALTADLKASN